MNFFYRSFFLFCDLRSEPIAALPRLFVHLSMLFYFSQTLSPLFKQHYLQFTGQSDILFPAFCLYSNFANLLISFQYQNLFILVYSIVLMQLIVPPTLILTIVLLKKILKIKISPNTPALKTCKWLFITYNWVLIIPTLETLMNPFDCDWYSFSKPCLTGGGLFLIFGVIFIVWACFLSFCLSFMKRDFFFLTHGLEFQWGGLRILIMILRYFIIIFAFLLKNWILGMYIALHAFGVLSFAEFFLENPNSNLIIREYYPIYLCIYESSLVLTSFWNYTSLISNDNFLNLLLLFWALSMKVGSMMSARFKCPVILTFDNNFPQTFSNIKAYPEPLTEEKLFLLMGFFTNHFKRNNCKESFCCRLRNMFEQDSRDFLMRAIGVNEFMQEKFGLFFNKKDFLSSLKNKKNSLILKYIDFLRVSAMNPRKLMFNFEIMKQKTTGKSLLMDLYLKWLDHQIKLRVFRSPLRKFTEKKVELEAGMFIKQSSYKTLFQEQIRELLLHKREFWNEYLLNFKDLEFFVEKVQKLSARIEAFKELIDRYNKDTNCKLITLKAYSALYSIFHNELAVAINFEEACQKIFTSELMLKQNHKEKLSIVDKKIVICEASFFNFNFEGVIRTESKTAKFGHFFGLSLGDTQLLKNVVQLMPSFLGNHHAAFVRNYINRPFNEPNRHPLQSFAQHKEGYIIPVNLHLSLKAAVDDFVVIVAIKHDEFNDDQIIVFNILGEILGVSKKMFSCLNFRVKNFKLCQFGSLNFFDLVPGLKTLIENKFIESEFLMNQHSILQIPADEKECFSIDSPRRKTGISSLDYNIDFDLRMHQHKISAKESIKLFNLTLKNIDNITIKKQVHLTAAKENIQVFPMKEEEHAKNMTFSSEGNIKPSLRSELKREDPKELIVKEKGFLEKESPVHGKIDLKQQINGNIKQSFIKTIITNDEPKSTKQNQNEILHQESSGADSKPIDPLKDDKIGPSHHSSVLRLRSKNFKVFLAIEKIKRFVPKSFWFFFLGILMEIILMLGYYLVLCTSENNYFQNSFYPTQTGIIRFVRQYACFCFTSEMMTIFEYRSLNLTSKVLENSYNDIYDRIYNQSFYLAKDTLFLELNSPKIQKYQTLYMEAPSFLAEISNNPIKIKEVTYFDLMDRYLEYMKTIMGHQNDLMTYNYDFLIFLQRNYPFYLLPSGLVFTEMRNSFMFYNVDLGNNLQNYIVIFLMLMFVVKAFESIQIFLLYRLGNRLAMIFLRCHQQEAFREINFIDSFLSNYDKKEDFLYLNFPEKTLLKREEFALFEENQKFTHVSEAKKSKPNAKTSNSIRSHLKPKRKLASNHIYSMKPLRKTKGVCFLILTLVLSFFYFFFNYYYWSISNQTVQEVIGLNSNYALAYAYSVSVLLCNNLYLREFIVRNPSYESLNNYYQQNAGRKAYFLNTTNKRISTITQIFDNEISKETIRAKSTVKDPNFEKLIDHNFCEVLLDFGKIRADDFLICGNMWDGTFRQGVIMGLNQYMRQLNEIEPLRASDENNSIKSQKILDYINNPNYQHLFLGEYFLSEALLIVYDYINQYYNPLIEQGRFNTTTGMVISMIFLGLFMILWAAWLAKYMKTYYKFLALSLSMMPYEKITEDEATIQIIENFTKQIG